MKIYKKLNEGTIEITDTDKAPKTIYIIDDLKKDKKRLEEELEEINDILEEINKL